ncbi:MAG: DEAD/DEAH box helicase family protein [bacterium]|nr:DEAD/DEAH box helicase family protein [bacterium]
MPGQGGATPVLLDGSAEGRLLPHLIDRLRDPDLDRIDMAVSFVMKSGLARILQPLEDALDRGAHVRILTTDYLAITDPDALTQLADLASGGDRRLEVRLFGGRSVAFHPKAYIFWSSAGEAAAGYVGSSNLSASGVDGGVEWNLGTDRVEQLVAGFESLWADRRSKLLDASTLRGYRETWRESSRTAATSNPDPSSEPADTQTPDPVPGAAPAPQPVAVAEEVRRLVGVPEEPPMQPVAPRPIQSEALEALERTRADGFDRAFVVMATGLGKTWLAAFDSARPMFRRVLFVAHRAEILRQSRDVFRRVRPGADLGLFMGDERAPDAEVVFASVQTLTQDRHLSRFDPTGFDYVVIDEFHHAAAPTYRRVLRHFRPEFLLGLTATPDRRDGADLLALCGDNLVFDCGLAEGIRRGELSPFHYWGIADVTDYAPIPWRSGRFDPDELATAIETRERAAKALSEWREKGGGPTLAFCSSISHARFMKEFFAAEGVRSAAVYSREDSDPRHGSVTDLQSGAIEVLFAVDVFNEGVDIPEVQTVLMLRPTDSPVVFLQQLGRGLRRTESNAALRVVDFVGNHHSFLSRPRTLLSLGIRTPSDAEVLESLQSGDFELPPGCAVEFDLEAIEILGREILGRLASPSMSEAERLGEFCWNYASENSSENWVRPTAAQAFSSVGTRPSSRSVSKAAGWHRYLDGLRGLDGLCLLLPEERAVVKELGEVLRRIEREPLRKAYKLVTLAALLELDALDRGAPVADVARVSRNLTCRDPRLRADTEQTCQVSDLDAVSDRAWLAFWRKNPLTHLSDKPHSLFELSADRFDPRFSVPAEHVATFASMVAEILEWRLRVYLRDRGAVDELVLRVGLHDGEPVILLDRTRHPHLPTGSTKFAADGRTFTGTFGADRLRFAASPGQTGNALTQLLYHWFGPTAGRFGYTAEVVLTRTGQAWEVRPREQPEAMSTAGRHAARPVS